jgi:hypothetical protein
MPETVGREHPWSRQTDEAFFVKLSQQSSTGDVFDLPIAISPVPTFCKFPAQPRPAPVRILFDEFPNKINIPIADQTALNESWYLHDQPYYHIL